MKTLVMKQNIIVSIFVVMLSMMYGFQGISYGQDAPDTIVEFSDANLAKAVREELGLPTGDGVEFLKIPKVELERLTTLSTDRDDITKLTGLEHASQLVDLNLYLNDIIDITPLAQLTQLTSLNLGYNDIIDITPLAQLTQLTSLDLGGNDISDITPLAQLIQLSSLSLSENQISDITPLAQLIQLSSLSLVKNQVSDITPLAGLISLEELYLGNNPIESKSSLFALLDVNPDVYIDISLDDYYIEGPWLWMIAPGGSITNDNLSEASDGVITEENIAQHGINEGEHFNNLQWTSGRLLPTTVCGIFFCSSDNVINVVREIGLTSAVQLTQYSAYALINIYSPTAQNEVMMGVGSDDSIRVWLNGAIVYTNNITRRTTGIQNRFHVNLNAGNNLLLVKVCNSGSWVGNDDWGMFFRIYLNPEDYTVSLPTDQSELTPTPSESIIVQVHPASVASPAVGEQITFNLNIAGGEAVASYQATVQFDTTTLRYVSGANGDFLAAGAFFVEPKVEGNLVKLNAASLAGETNGAGTLATLTFEVIAAKASTLTLSDVLITNSVGEAFVPTVKNAKITGVPQLNGDVNGDGIVNIQDLVLVAGQLGQTGVNSADINGDGQVNIQDLVLVAGALGTTAAAPSLHPHALETLTATEVEQWLSEAQRLGLTDIMSQRGILFLQQVLIALTPKETALLASYPNPFNPETWIPYQLAKPADVTLRIYAVNGTLVRTLTLGHQPAGMYQSRSRAAYWDGKNEFGEKVASGVYFYTLTASDFTATRKMLIRK